MWSPDRPPARPPRSTRSSHFRSATSIASFGTPPRQPPTSTASLDSRSFHSAFADADDDSSCDDTYVSMSSKKESLFEESPRILKETSRVTNAPSRRSPGLPRKKEFRPHTISRAESSGILDKLKSDINSLDIIRNSSYAEETSTAFSGSVFDFEDENKSVATKSVASSVPSVIERSRSVDRSFRREEMRGPLVVDAIRQRHGGSSLDGRESRLLNADRQRLGENTSGAASVGSRRDMSRKHNELREKLQKEKQEMQNQSMVDRNRGHLEGQLSEKDEKISKLQDTIRGLKREVVMEKDENERCSATLSDLKYQLKECKAKEAETQSALREVMKNVEHERSVREKEMHLASKVQGAEVLMLEEKLAESEKDFMAKTDALKDDIAKKSSVIEGLRQDIRQLQSKLDSSSRSKADSDKTLRSQIERLELRLDNETVAHRKKIAELNEMHQSSEEDWSEKLNSMKARIEEQNAREAEWTDELSMTKLELENLRAYSVSLENQNQYLKSSADDVQKLERECDELKHDKVKNGQTIDDLRKELEVAHEAKASLARQVEAMKKTEAEKDDYINKMEDSLEELDDDKQEYIDKIEQLQKELSESLSECQDTKVLLEEAKGATADAKTQLQDATSKLEKSMNDGRMLAKQVNEKENENAKMVKAISSMETKFKQEMDEHSVEVTNHQKHLSQMSKASSELEGKINEMQREIKSYQNQLSKIPKLETKIKELTESLAQSEDKQSTLQSKLKNTISKLDESELNYDRLDKKHKALMRDQSEFEEREKSYASNATKREREQIDAIHKLKKEKNDQISHIERLQEEVVRAKKEVSQAKEETKKCKDQLKTALQSLDEMMKYIDGMKEESDDMIKALESETEGLMKRIGVLEKHREFDQQTIKLYEEEKNERTKQIRNEYQQKSHSELQKIKSEHEQEIQDVRSRYECRIKELQSTIAQRSEITKSLQEHGTSEVSNLMKRVGDMTEKHSKDLRAMREKYEAELAEESSAKNALKATLRELESKNEDLNDALKAASVTSSNKSLSGGCTNCEAVTKTLKEKEQACNELKTKLQEQSKNESKLRGELAQNKQLMTITQANEKLLEDHVASLEAQIDTLVADYESKLGG